MRESAAYMKAHSIAEKAENLEAYYLYYGTLALYQHQGDIWKDWNDRMKQVLIPAQQKTGPDAGSWTPSTTTWTGPRMGRLVTTVFSTLSLQVYYRILPIYGMRRDGK